MDKKNILTYEGLKKLEDELQNLKVVKRKEVAQKIKEAREQGDLSENAEYDAAKDEQRDIRRDTGWRVILQGTRDPEINRRLREEMKMAGQNNGKQGGQQQDVNQLLKVRREKLANLQEAGQDPFQITKYDVTHHTSDVKELYNAHEEKLLAGRPAVNTDGMDEAAAREAVKAEKICMQPSRNPISEISGALRDTHSAQRQEKSPSMRRR